MGLVSKQFFDWRFDTWQDELGLLILLIISIFGVSFIGIQVFVYRKCVSALEKISLPSTTVTLKKFNFQIHRSRLLLSDIIFKEQDDEYGD